MDDEQRLNELAGRILDGRGMDWKAEASPGADADAALLAELKVLADIVELHRRGQGDTAQRDGDAAAGGPGPASTRHRWGPLELIEKVGEGSFADVYRARDPHLDRDVALKLLSADGYTSPTGSSVVAEGKLLASVRHPNVVTVYGAGTFGGRVGIWTEFVWGQTLEAELAEHGPMGAREVALIGVDLCRALAAVHGAGVLHRDVKARNVMREGSGRLVLMDFGMGRLASEAPEEHGSSGGTPLYMAPELFDGGPATVPSDVYALGVLLWHLLTASYPVTGADLAEVREAHRTGRRARLREERPDLEAVVVDVVERAVEADPARRFQTTGEMEAALGAALGADGSGAGSVSGVTRSRRPRIGRAWLGTGVAAAAILVAAVGWYVMERGPGGPAVALGERPWVLVAAFENQSGERALTGAIEAALERELEQSAVVRVVPAVRIQDALRLMKREPDAPLTVVTALDVARRDSGIGAVVSGRIFTLGGRFHLEGRVLEARTGLSLGSFGEEAGSDGDLPAAVRRLSSELRRRLGESADQIRAADQTLEQVTTPSFESLRLYSEAVRVAADGRGTDAALALARAAIDADPTFASAHALVASLLMNKRERDQAEVAIDRAASLAGSVTEAERLLIEALRLEVHRQRDEATAAYEAYLRLRPDDHRVLERIVIAYSVAGRYEDLVRASMRAAALRPNDFMANYRAAWYGVVFTGKLQEAQPFLARARALETPDSNPAAAAWLRFEPVFEDWLRGDAPGGAARLDVLARMENSDPSHGALLAGFNIAFGRLRAAEAALDRAGATQVTWFLRAEIGWSRGDVPGAQSALRTLLGMPRSGPWLALGVNRVPALLVRVGMIDEAAALVASEPAETKQESLAFPPAEGEVALARGEPARAARLLGGWDQLAGGIPARAVAALSYAEALERLGDPAGVARVLEPLASERVHMFQRLTLPTLWYLQSRPLLARAYRALGRAAEAEAIEAELRAVLAEADADFVLLQQIAR